MSNSTNILSFKMDNFKKLIRTALSASEQGHEILFKDSTNKQNALIAATYINKAISIMSAAKAIYISDIEELENLEAENIFHKFDVFENEFLTNLSSNHSHQWTDIEFQAYKESVEYFIQ